ncbi:hypothetical protein BGX27_002593 [Mortierella sp. AM989]|nr:hypothetical protein BGX27_002593 [Mortierella sp. AM989]
MPPSATKRLKLPGMHVFFTDPEIHPNDWTPWNFANHSSGLNFDNYYQGLCKLRRAGKLAVCAQAANIVRWIDDPANENLVTMAKLRITEKIAAQSAEMASNARRYNDGVNLPPHKKPRVASAASSITPAASSITPAASSITQVTSSIAPAASSITSTSPETTSSASDSLPPIEIDEPWRVLMVACINKLRNHSTDGLDKLSLEGLQKLEIVIFKISRRLLQQSHLSTQETKDLMVAMSGILDLRAWDYSQAPAIAEPVLNTQNNDIDQLNIQLSRDLRLGVQMFTLKCEARIGEIAKAKMRGEDVPATTPMLRLVVHLATLIERGNMPNSEGEIVALWKSTLEILSEGRLKFLSGEKICKSTQAAKRQFKDIFGVEGETDSGRRVDLLLRVGDLEILNTEAKALNNEGQCNEQYKKNIRINHAIYREAKRNGVELPPMLPLDIRGLSAMICHLKKASDTVFVAGAAVNRMISLPKDKEELHKFLEGSSSQLLWNYVILGQIEEKIELSTTVNRNRQIFSFDDFDDKNETNHPCTPPQELKIGDTTVLTPKRSIKQLKFSTLSGLEIRTPSGLQIRTPSGLQIRTPSGLRIQTPSIADLTENTPNAQSVQANSDDLHSNITLGSQV